MEKRVKFRPGDQKEFLGLVLKKSGLSISELSSQIKISSRTFFDWRKEKLTIPLLVVKRLSREYEIKLPESEARLCSRWQKSRSMAARAGGYKRFLLHGCPATSEGRSRGGRRSLEVMREKGIIPQAKKYREPNHCPGLAEFVGILLGDGGLTTNQAAITLNRVADRSYAKYVSSLGLSLFGEEPRIYDRQKNGCLILYYNSVNLVQYLVTRGMIVGNKVKHQVDVPEWVKNDREYSRSCLKGLIDTDGGVHWHGYSANGSRYRYAKLCFSNRSLPLIDFVYQTLKANDLGPKLASKMETKKVWLYNYDQVRRYFSLIGSNNERLLKYWRVAPNGKAQVC